MKTEENVKEELFRLLKETNDKCETAFNKMVEQVTMPDSVISITNQYKKIVRTQRRRLLCFYLNKDTFWSNLRTQKTFERIGLSKYIIYFKIIKL